LCIFFFTVGLAAYECFPDFTDHRFDAHAANTDSDENADLYAHHPGAQ